MDCHSDRVLGLDIKKVEQFVRETTDMFEREDSKIKDFPKGSYVRTDTRYSLLSFGVKFPENSKVGTLGFGGFDLEDYIKWLEQKLEQKEERLQDVLNKRNT